MVSLDSIPLQADTAIDIGIYITIAARGDYLPPSLLYLDTHYDYSNIDHK